MAFLPEGAYKHVSYVDVIFDQEEIHPHRMCDLYNFFNVTACNPGGIIPRAVARHTQ